MTTSKSFYSFIVAVIISLSSFLEASLARAETHKSPHGCEEIRHVFLDSQDNMFLRLSNNLDHISEPDDLVNAINTLVDSATSFITELEGLKKKYPTLFEKEAPGTVNTFPNLKMCNLQQIVEQKSNNEWGPTKEALNNAMESYKTNASVLKARQRLLMVKM